MDKCSSDIVVVFGFFQPRLPNRGNLLHFALTIYANFRLLTAVDAVDAVHLQCIVSGRHGGEGEGEFYVLCCDVADCRALSSPHVHVLHPVD